MNDPNGLVYHDGSYELYYQYNPYGVEWNHISWGHAKSTDLLHWENLPVTLTPDEDGYMFSGCGIRNDRAFGITYGCLAILLYGGRTHVAGKCRKRAFRSCWQSAQTVEKH